MLRILDLRSRRAATLSLSRNPGRVGGPVAFRVFEVESVIDGYLIPDKRCDELAVSVVLEAADGLHLLKDGRHRRKGFRQFRFGVTNMPDV